MEVRLPKELFLVLLLKLGNEIFKRWYNVYNNFKFLRFPSIPDLIAGGWFSFCQHMSCGLSNW